MSNAAARRLDASAARASVVVCTRASVEPMAQLLLQNRGVWIG
jgi:hypothetical protein